MDILKVEEKRDITYWNNSEFHRINIIDKRYKFLGIPVFRTKKEFISKQDYDVNFYDGKNNKSPVGFKRE